LKDNDQIKSEPNNTDVVLRRIVRIKEGKYKFPRDIGTKGRYRHTIGSLSKT
jgi:hypothetical protein